MGSVTRANEQTAEELAAQLQVEQAALDSLKLRLELEEKQLQRSRVKQETEAQALTSLERTIFQVKSELRTVQKQERDLSKRREKTQQDLRQSESRLRNRETGMATRARQMYKLGRRGTLEILFSSESFADAVKRIRYLSRVAQQDRKDYRSLLDERKRIGNLFAVTDVQYRQQQSLLQEKQKKENRLQGIASDKAQVLKQLESSVSQKRQAIREMRAQEAESAVRLAQLIKEVQEARLRGRRLAELPPFDFAGSRGFLKWPVSGKVVTEFGRYQDPDLKTWTFHRGMNIAAPEGTNVLAIAPGEVVMVDWFPGYGRFVLLRHAEPFFSLYGHLDSDLVGVGDILPSGTAVGTVGSTGRLDGVSQLHFEIMQDEDPLDPKIWLGKE
ncbi:MAG: peptidoglycan DD-metalloendopeptidase family protein, partial [bacterium]|nr:peptidoglycan DD-metalloendopeptidase family protein [bacterium]